MDGIASALVALAIDRELVAYGVIVGIPLAWHLALAAFAYVDAPKYGMDPQFWGGVSLLVPFFGVVTYLFERDERVANAAGEAFADEHFFEVHESRADDVEFDWDGDVGSTTNRSAVRDSSRRSDEDDGAEDDSADDAVS